jgi:hypothetical protein
MKSQIKKLAVLIGFVGLFIGSALWMYFKYIHNKPKIKIIAPKTTVDPIKFDSVLFNTQHQIKKH